MNATPSMLPPNDLDAERCSLGSLILSSPDEGVFLDIASRLHPEWFYFAVHGAVLRAILSLRSEGVPIDAVTLLGRLSAESVDGQRPAALIAEILSSVPDWSNGPHYADIVREKARLRAAMQAGYKAVEEAQKPDAIADEVAQRIIDRGVRILSQGKLSSIPTMEEIMTETFDQITAPGETRLLPTGFPSLDDEIGGLGLGETAILAARPSMGKSLLMKNIAANISGRGIPVGVVSLEEGRFKIARNMLAAHASIENRRLRGGGLTGQEIDKLALSMNELSKLPMMISDGVSTIGEVCAAISAMVGRHKCQLVCIDYLQLILPENQREPREQQVAGVSRRLAQTFKRLGIAGLVLAQVNRGSEIGTPRPPTLTNLRESGQIEQDADLVMFIHRQDYYRSDRNLESEYTGGAMDDKTDCAEVIIAKMRDGQRNSIVKLKTEMKYQRFVDVSPGTFAA